MPSQRALLVWALGCTLAGSVHATEADDVHWGYDGELGPAAWHELHPSFDLCGHGRAQSPIDLGVPSGETRVPVSFDYAPTELRISHQEHVVDVVNDGHTIQVDYDEGSTITKAGIVYDLVQYHFHAPSEHSINGLHYPMEMHLVHQAKDGRILVLAIFIREGTHNEAFEPVWTHMPRTPGDKWHGEHVKVDIDDLLPTDRRTLRYEGSLTTPPCSEGVRWMVGSNPVALSREQIDAFRKVVGSNARPVQDRRGRPVIEVLPEL